MANKLIKGLTIQIGADTSALGKAMQSAEAQVKSARNELKEISNALKNNGDSAELWNQKQQVLTKALEESKKKLDTLKTAQKSLSDQLKDGDIDKSAYDKFQEKLKKSKDKLEELKKQQETVEAQYKSDEIDKGAYDKFCKKVETAEKQVKDLETAEHSLEENLQIGNITEEQYRAFKREMESAENDVKYFSGQLENTNQKLGEMGGEADSTAKEVDDLGDKAKESGEQAESAANGGYSVMKNVLANLVTDGIRLAADELKDFTKDVVTTGMTFESAMSSVGAIAGSSAEEMEFLNDKAKEMGATTKFTAAQSAEAFQYMAMAGWKTEDMLSGIDGVLSLAAASGEDLGTTSDIVTDALTAFGLTAGDTGHFVDVLAAASSNANTNVSMMGETFKYAAPIAGALGYSIEDTAEAIGLMANSGIKASQAGTSLRTIMTNLSGDFTVSGKAIGDVTVKTQNADGTMRSFSEILNDTREAFAGLTEAEKASNAEELAGKNAMSGFLALVNAAPADIDKLSGAIENCDDAAQGMSETMQDNLSGDITLFESAVDGMKISLSEELTPVLRDTVQYATKKMPDIENALGKIFTAGGKVVKGAVKYLPIVVDTTEELLPLITGVGAAFAAWKAAQKVKEVTEAVKGLKSAMSVETLGLTLLLSGIAETALEVKRAHDEYETASERISKKVKEQYEDINAAVKDIGDSINDVNSNIEDSLNAADIETQKAQDLWKELDTLADSSGKVKDADKIRAEYILGELNDALGTEYTMTSNQIENYQTLEKEIDNVIEKKKAMAYIDAYQSNLSEMAAQKANIYEAYDSAYTAQQESLTKFEEANAERYGGAFGTDAGSLNDFIKWYEEEYDGKVPNVLDSQMYEAAKSLQEINPEVIQLQNQYKEVSEYYNKLERAQEAFYKGEYEQVENLLYFQSDADRAILESATEWNDKVSEAYKNSLNKVQSEIALVRSSEAELVQSEVNNLVSDLTETITLGLQAGGDEAELITDDVKDYIQYMLDEGFDISKLAEWGAASGLKVGRIFGDDYTSIVQSQIDKGYDAAKLIEWGMNSGALTGEEFWEYYDQNCKNGFDTTFGDGENGVSKDILAWARRTGEDVGNLFGEKYSETVSKWTQWLYSEGMTVPKSIQSDSDAQKYAKGTYKLYAKGGEIREGEGIIAEAGPELLTVKNGIAKVTPLTDTAQIHAIEAETSPGLIDILNGSPAGRAVNRSSTNASTGGNPAGKLVYVQNTINATIRDDYDVSRLAERLAAEQRRIEAGKGLQ